MGEIAVNQNSTIVLPVPLDLFKPFLEVGNDGSSGGGDGYEGKTSPQQRHEEAREAEKRYKETLEDVSREGSSGEVSVEMPNQEVNP